MNRYLSEQLMTVEEAERLSELHTGRGRRRQPARQPVLWVLTDEQIDAIDAAMNSKSGCPRLFQK
jgi:hypothetical protein